MSRILVADDESLMREFLTETLISQNYEVVSAENGEQAIEFINNDTCDLILTDYKMPKYTGIDVLKKAREKMPDCKVIIMTAYGTVENAVEAMKLGAFDYIVKPFSLDEILILVKRVLKYKSLEIENRMLHTELEEFYGYKNIIGESAEMKKVFEIIETVSKSRSTVLITGESGTGKELVARAIHFSSLRKDKPFIKINCAALPAELMESELFGHEKGAFTGAVRRYNGRFERADSGTLLLDEISEMNPQLQAKLLRVLQEREFEPVGSSDTIKVDVRIIATTNVNLSVQIDAGDFRDDLYYRLNVINIHISPLRKRLADIPFLARHFFEKYNRENGKAIEGISDEVLNIWRQHNWPGNVRELENAVERAVVMCKGRIVELSDISLPGERPGQETDIRSTAVRESSSDIAVDVGTCLSDVERELILKTLESEGGNRTNTADILGISVRTLRNKLAQYGKMDAFK